MQDNSAVVMWVAILACSSAVQTALLVVGAMFAWRRMRAIELRLMSIEREDVRPALARLELALADVQDVGARLRRADDDIRRAWRTATDVTMLAVRRAWPIWGAVDGARAALRAFGGSRRPRPVPATGRTLDEMDRLRFVGEGGETNA